MFYLRKIDFGDIELEIVKRQTDAILIFDKVQS